MIAVDTNLLVYAHRRDSEWHDEAASAIRSLFEPLRITARAEKLRLTIGVSLNTLVRMPRRLREPLPPLGALEEAVLEHLWRAGEADVIQAHRAVGTPRGIGVNTVGSALERLHRKGLASRADLHFGSGPQGEVYLLNKADGVIRLLVPGRD